METTGTTTNKETEFLTVKNSPRSGRDAATQTPQMRHPTPARRQQVRGPSNGSSSSEESLAYEDSIPYASSIKNACVPIPAVIIEYSKDTLPLATKEVMDSNSVDHTSGVTNLAFESQGEMMRYPPTIAFKQNTDGYQPSGPVFLQPNQRLLFASNLSDPLGPSTVGDNRRLYYSLPRAHKKKCEKDLMIRSQPPTPQMNRTKDTGVDTNSTFWIIPREDSVNSLNTVSASAAKYVTPDSVSGIYTISGGPAVVTNGYPETVMGLYEMHLVPPVATSAKSTPKSVRKFEFTKMPASVDRKRIRLQRFTDAFSLLLLLPGLGIAGITPALVTPLFYVAPELFAMYIMIFMASGTLATLFLVFSGIVGNIVWHYDEDTKKLKPRLHCGNGPTFHFWGNAFFSSKNEAKEKEVIV